MDNQIIFGVTDEQSGYKDEILLTNMSNRHGCITGATGTGKTVSLQKLAELMASIDIYKLIFSTKTGETTYFSSFRPAIFIYPSFFVHPAG